MKSTLSITLLASCLNFFATPVLALVMDLNSDKRDMNLTFDHIEIPQSTRQHLNVLIDQNPILAAKQLEKYFSETGDISTIRSLLPRIFKKTRDHDGMYALYALSLATNKDTVDLNKYINKESVKSSDYYNLILAIVNKNENNIGKAINLTRAALTDKPDLAYSHNLLGSLYSTQNKHSLALKHFQKARELAPKFAAAHANIGAIQYFLGKTKLSAAAFTEAILLTPKACNPRFGRAIVAESLHLYNDAIVDLQYCLEDITLSLAALRKLSTLSLNSNQTGEARKYAMALKAKSPNLYHQISGEAALRDNNLDNAIKHLKQVSTKNARTNLLLALSFAIEGNDKLALTTANKLTKEYPQYVAGNILTMVLEIIMNQSANTPMTNQLANNKITKTYVAFLRGINNATLGDTKNALLDLQQAEGFYQGFSMYGITSTELKNIRKKELSTLALGTFLYLTKMPGLAANQFEQTLTKNQSSLFGNYFSALTSYGQKDYKLATKRLKITLNQAPKYFSANYLMGETLVAMQLHQKAISFYEKASDVKIDAGVLLKLGLLNEFTGKLPKAEIAYENLIKHFPNHYVGYNQLAWHYAKQSKNIDKGIQLARKANELQQENISINDTLGWLYFKKDDYKNALKYLVKANQLSGNKKPDILYHLAAAQNALGKTSDAKANLLKAFELTNHFDGHKKARQLLSSIAE